MGTQTSTVTKEPGALGKVCAMKPRQGEALVPCPLSLACPLAPTWLLFPFWMHSDFFSKGASHEIWDKERSCQQCHRYMLNTRTTRPQHGDTTHYYSVPTP